MCCSVARTRFVFKEIQIHLRHFDTHHENDVRNKGFVCQIACHPELDEGRHENKKCVWFVRFAMTHVSRPQCDLHGCDCSDSERSPRSDAYGAIDMRENTTAQERHKFQRIEDMVRQGTRTYSSNTSRSSKFQKMRYILRTDRSQNRTK